LAVQAWPACVLRGFTGLETAVGSGRLATGNVCIGSFDRLVFFFLPDQGGLDGWTDASGVVPHGPPPLWKGVQASLPVCKVRLAHVDNHWPIGHGNPVATERDALLCRPSVARTRPYIKLRPPVYVSCACACACVCHLITLNRGGSSGPLTWKVGARRLHRLLGSLAYRPTP
jgi:hypothetical protein